MVSKKVKKILIVEDDIQLMTSLREKVKHAGFDVFTARDGVIGLRTAIKEKPDLILLDVIMPRMDGLEMLSDLRKNKWGSNALVILLSNDDDPDHISETLKSNATDYLIKSDWKLDDIIIKINDTLGLT